jgi:hypothetical protein
MLSSPVPSPVRPARPPSLEGLPPVRGSSSSSAQHLASPCELPAEPEKPRHVEPASSPTQLVRRCDLPLRALPGWIAPDRGSSAFLVAQFVALLDVVTAFSSVMAWFCGHSRSVSGYGSVVSARIGHLDHWLKLRRRRHFAVPWQGGSTVLRQCESALNLGMLNHATRLLS